MAGRRFDVVDVVEALRLWGAGKTDREITRSKRQLDVGLTTFRLYVRKRIGTVRPENATVRTPPPPPGEIAEVGLRFEAIAQSSTFPALW